jgi:hypothetical protein
MLTVLNARRFVPARPRKGTTRKSKEPAGRRRYEKRRRCDDGRSADESGGINSVAMIPISGGEKLGGVPVGLQTKDTIDFAGQAIKLAGLMGFGGGRERICRIENKIHFGVFSTPAPTIPRDMLQVSVCRGRLCCKPRLVITRPYQPSFSGADRQVVLEQWYRKNPKDGQHR